MRSPLHHLLVHLSERESLQVRPYAGCPRHSTIAMPYRNITVKLDRGQEWGGSAT